MSSATTRPRHVCASRGVPAFAWCIAVVVAFFARPASAAPTDADLGELSGLAELYPEARTLPPPAWLTPGTRISYSGGSASFEGGGAAASLIQYDVVAADGGQISSYGHAYGDVGTGVLPLGGGRVVGYPGIGPFWINPTVLTNAESFSGGPLTVTRYDGDDGEVVRFQTQTTNGQTVVEVSAVTGILVFSAINSPGSASQQELLGTRVLPLPWTPDRIPNWVRPQTTLEYSGTRSTTIAEVGTFDDALASNTVVVDAGARWAVLELTTTLNGAPQGLSRTLNGGAQMFGGFFLPRSAASAALSSTATAVDLDPYSGAQLFIHRRPSDDAIVVRVETAASEVVSIYDAAFLAMRGVQSTQNLGQSLVVDTLTYSGGSDLDALDRLPEVPDDPPLPEDPGPGGTDSAGDDSDGDDSDGDGSAGNDTDGSTGGDADDESESTGGNTPDGTTADDSDTDGHDAGAESDGGCRVGRTGAALPLLLTLLLLRIGSRKRGTSRRRLWR